MHDHRELSSLDMDRQHSLETGPDQKTPIEGRNAYQSLSWRATRVAKLSSMLARLSLNF